MTRAVPAARSRGPETRDDRRALPTGQPLPASLAALFSELFPDGLRGTGMGFCYNAGRLASGLLPLGVGLLSEICGLGPAIGLSALGAYGLVLLAVALLPDRQSGGALIPQTVR